MPVAAEAKVAEKKMEQEKPETPKSTARGFLGVTCNKANLQICEVSSVYADGATEQAGITKGDVIVGINDTAITSFGLTQESNGNIDRGTRD